MAPVVEEVTRELAGRVKTVKVNVDEAPGTAGQYDVRGVPTLLLLRDGKVAARQVGALPSRELRRWITEQLERTAA